MTFMNPKMTKPDDQSLWLIMQKQNPFAPYVLLYGVAKKGGMGGK